jgi:3-phenylpropionate/cinnamic acid dioxygenase small subunit
MSSSAEITQTLNRLAWGTDLRRIDYIERCYTPDAVFTVSGGKGRVVEGRDAILAGIQNTWAKTPPTIGHHLITNILVESESANEAEVVSYKTVVRVVDDRPVVVSSGWYRDRLVKGDGEWKIAARTLTNDAQI